VAPETSQAYGDYGYFLDNISRYAEAIEMYQKAVELKPDDYWIWKQMGWAYSNMGDNTNAEQALIKAVEQAKSDWYYTNLGNFYRDRLKDYGKALESYQKALGITPGYLDAYSQIGRMYYNQNKYVEAEGYFKKEIEVAPDSAKAYNDYGSFLDDLSRYAEAIEMYQKSVELKPDDYWTWKQMGWAYSNSGDQVNAERVLIKAAELARSDWYYTNLGNFYRDELKDYGKALENYQKALAVSPYYLDAYSAIGWMYYTQDKYKEAESYYKKEIEVAPETSQAYGDYGFFLDNISRYTEAIEMYQKAVELKPDDYWTWKQMGWAYSNSGDKANAEQALVRAAELAEKVSNSWYLANLGDFYRSEMGDDKKALQNYLKAIEISSDYAYAHRRAGDVYYSLNDKVNANKYYRIYLTLEQNPQDYVLERIK
jgi:tetratricopeptide (TPR) repeat protein